MCLIDSTLKLTHNAAIYNNKGSRNGRVILKKGKIYTAYNIKKIKGKKYFHLSKGRYIKSSNAKKYVVMESNVLFTVNVPDEVKAHKTPNGKEIDNYVAGEQNVYEQRSDAQGIVWYRIGNNKWISSQDTNKPQGAKVNNSTNSVSQNNSSNNIAPTTNAGDSNSQTTNGNSSQSGSTTTQQPSTKPTTPTSTILDRQIIEATSQSFIKIINDWRAAQGVPPVIYNGSLYDHAVQRAIHNAQSWDETKHSDHHSGALYGESMTLVKYGTPTQMAQAAFNQFVYNDAAANYGHRDALKDKNMKRLCVGLAKTTNNGYYKNGVVFVEVQTAY